MMSPVRTVESDAGIKRDEACSSASGRVPAKRIARPVAMAPRNTPAEVIEKLNGEINACLADPKMQARLADLGVEPTPTKPAEFGKLIAGETEKWGKVIRAANIKVE